jgi:hypothetical protein
MRVQPFDLRQAPSLLGFGHSAVVTQRSWSSHLVLFAQGSFQKDLWIDRKEIPVRNRKVRSDSKEIKNDPVNGRRPKG